jgi:hypothetical protein
MNNEINELFEKNKINDLKNFLSRRHCLNRCNSSMIYLFHIIQTFGILASSISAATNDQTLLWIGISLNMTASIIQIYEKINHDQMKRILLDIQSIKNNTYIDESAYIDPEEANVKNSVNQSKIKESIINQPVFNELTSNQAPNENIELNNIKN